MGAPTAQVQSSQTSQPASKGAGVSPSTPGGSGKGGQISSMSGQPKMGQPNTNGNAPIAPVNAGFVAQNDGKTNGNPYPNTIGNMTMVQGGINARGDQSPVGKGGGSGQSGGKGAAAGGAVGNGNGFNPMMQIENTYQPGGPTGPGASY